MTSTGISHAAFDVIDESVALVADEAMQTLVADVAARVRARDGERFARLRRAAVHNDPNDYNVLVEAGTIAGLLDFGDIVHSFAIADLAIAIAYAVLDKRDPLDAAVAVVRGYARTRPLDDDEVAALFGLVLLRLCVSVCIAARQQRQRPERSVPVDEPGADRA